MMAVSSPSSSSEAPEQPPPCLRAFWVPFSNTLYPHNKREKIKRAGNEEEDTTQRELSFSTLLFPQTPQRSSASASVRRFPEPLSPSRPAEHPGPRLVPLRHIPSRATPDWATPVPIGRPRVFRDATRFWRQTRLLVAAPPPNLLPSSIEGNRNCPRLRHPYP